MKTTNHDERIAKMTFASVFPFYVAKVEKKGRTVNELYQVIEWLTGYDQEKVNALIDEKVQFSIIIPAQDILFREAGHKNDLVSCPVIIVADENLFVFGLLPVGIERDWRISSFYYIFVMAVTITVVTKSGKCMKFYNRKSELAEL